MQREWQRPGERTTEAAERLSREQGIPRPVAYSLVRRGLEDVAVRDHFLNPRLKSLGDPMVFAQMDRAVTRVWEAVDGSERIFVHGDYDVDGITGTAFLTRTLRALGADVVPFVPSRSEGYGLGAAGIAAAKKERTDLLITVDCGMTAFDAVRELDEAGIDVIIVDHHQPADTLPAAVAVINPFLGTGARHFTNLSAVGVAAKLLHAIAIARPGSLPPEDYKEALQLVALGTIADVVPLLDENRILVSYGLRRLSRSRWVGIQALKATARLSRPRISATDVAFSLAPRINAVGRMGNARDALALLLADDPVEAYRLADQVERMNADRRRSDDLVLREALDALTALPEVPPAVVLWSEGWPVGVIGIAASRLVDRYHRPVVLLSVEGATARASARSPAAFPLPPALNRCADLFLEHGGHAQAAGFTIPTENLEAFRTRFLATVSGADILEEAGPWVLDATVGFHELTPECVSWLERLEPFGNGNPEPLFGGEGFVLAESPSVVGARHMRLVFEAGEGRLRGIAFNQARLVEDFSRGQRVDTVFHAGFDTWRGGRHVQIVVKDLKAG